MKERVDPKMSVQAERIESIAAREVEAAISRPTAGALSPTTFRRYRVGFQIAYGGTAAVHLGLLEGPSGLRRPVAMKRIRAGIPKEEEIRIALSGEARLGAFIRHPNVVPILDLVEADGELLLVMEYVVGETLARLQRSADQRLPLGIVVAILSDVLRGLHAAHIARGGSDERLHIVHRDVSPQNVLVGVDGVARIMDFGMARAVSSEQTSPGYVKGKLGYLAPEQITGEPVDARTDVFAAGIVLWEALAGRRLFPHGGPVRGMLRHLTGKIPPPSKFNTGVPKQMDKLVARALLPSLERRFATAEEFADAIEAAVRPASSSEVARYLQGHVGLAIEMQRTLLRGLQTQAGPAQALDTQDSCHELWCADEGGTALSESGVRDAFDPKRYTDTLELHDELEETTHFYVARSQPPRLVSAPSLDAAPRTLPPPKAPSRAARGKGVRRTVSRDWIALVAMLVCACVVAGVSVARWARSPAASVAHVAASKPALPTPAMAPASRTAQTPTADAARSPGLAVVTSGDARPIDAISEDAKQAKTTKRTNSFKAIAKTRAVAQTDARTKAHAPKAAPSAPKRRLPASCSPPYRYDGYGIKRMKLSCL